MLKQSFIQLLSAILLLMAIPSIADGPETDDNLVVDPNDWAMIREEGFRDIRNRFFNASPRNRKSLIRSFDWLKSIQKDNGSFADSPELTALVMLLYLTEGKVSLVQSPYADVIKKQFEYLSEQLQKDREITALERYALAEALAVSKSKKIHRLLTDQANKMVHKVNITDWDINDFSWELQSAYRLNQAYKGVPAFHEFHQNLKKEYLSRIWKDKKLHIRPGKESRNHYNILNWHLQLYRHSEAGSYIDKVAEQRYQSMHQARQKENWDRFANANMHIWYYDTLAHFNQGGINWLNWRAKMQIALNRNQNEKGYWEIKGDNFGSEEKSRIRATCLAALQLTVFYRYPRPYKIDLARQKEADKK